MQRSPAIRKFNVSPSTTIFTFSDYIFEMMKIWKQRSFVESFATKRRGNCALVLTKKGASDWTMCKVLFPIPRCCHRNVIARNLTGKTIPFSQNFQKNESTTAGNLWYISTTPTLPLYYTGRLSCQDVNLWKENIACNIEVGWNSCTLVSKEHCFELLWSEVVNSPGEYLYIVCLMIF